MTALLEATERIDPLPAYALAQLLGVDPPTDTLPPLWHWLYFLDRTAPEELAPDGHLLEGIPAPPRPGMRRMFGGGRVRTHALLRVDEPATMSAHLVCEQVKQGRSGPLHLVTVEYRYTQGEAVVITDQKDIVYRDPAPVGPAPTTTMPAPDRWRPLTGDLEGDGFDLNVDAPMLFRFSALTYNAHRIHYDLSWCAAEGYDDLVIHGPLQALLLGQLATTHGVDLVGAQFSYRLVKPMTGPQTVRMRDTPDQSERFGVYRSDGERTALASVTAS